jgi:hypothetical protein
MCWARQAFGAACVAVVPAAAGTVARESVVQGSVAGASLGEGEVSTRDGDALAHSSNSGRRGDVVLTVVMCVVPSGLWIVYVVDDFVVAVVVSFVPVAFGLYVLPLTMS